MISNLEKLLFLYKFLSSLFFFLKDRRKKKKGGKSFQTLSISAFTCNTQLHIKNSARGNAIKAEANQLSLFFFFFYFQEQKKIAK